MIDERSDVVKQIVFYVAFSVCRGILQPGDVLPLDERLTGGTVMNPNRLSQAVRRLQARGIVEMSSTDESLVVGGNARQNAEALLIDCFRERRDEIVKEMTQAGFDEVAIRQVLTRQK